MKKKLCIFGAGGLAKEVYCLIIDLGLKHKVDSFLESDNQYMQRKVFDINVNPFSYFNPNKHKAIIAIGDSSARMKIVNQFPKNTEFETLIHPDTVISEWVDIGEGSIICAGTILTCNIVLGKHTLLNLASIIGHDCKIGDYFTTGPSVSISGNCEIGNCVYIGTGSAVREKIKIISNITIGMGSNVVKNITQPGIYIGNPTKLLKRNNTFD